MKKFLCLLSLMILPLTSCTTVYIDVTVMPRDAKLAYWVGDIIDNEEIDQDFIFTFLEEDKVYLDHNYAFDIAEDGSKKMPKINIYYSIEKYDDRHMIVDFISITDLNITIYGLSINSSENEIYDKLTSCGFTYFDGYSGRNPNYTKDGLSIEITSYHIAIY